MKPSLPIQPTLLALAIASASSHSFAAESSNTNTSAGNAANTEEEITLSTDQLSPLVVKGQTYRNTATKTQLDLEETPQAISIIDSDQLEERGVESLSEALRYTSGVNTELRGGTITRLDLFNIRGFDNDQVYYDGLPLLYNGNNLQAQVDASAVEKIEVFKGPASTLYGSMPPGGMVNLIGKSPQKESKNSIEVTVGSDNKKEASFDSTGAISENINYRVIGLVREKDGQADTTSEERMMIAPSIDWQISDDTLLNLNLYYQKDPSMGTYGTLPGVGTVYDNSPYGQLDSDAYFGDENFETFEREVLFFGYKLSHKINDTWSFLQKTRYTTANAYQETAYVTGLKSDQTTGTRTAYSTDEESEAFAIDNQFSAIFDVGETEHNILLGVDYTEMKSNFTYYSATNTPSIDLYNPDNNQIVVSDLGLTKSSDLDYDSQQLGFYLQDQVRVGQWILIAGGRYDQYNYDESGLDEGDDTIDEGNFSGRLAALYEFENGISPFISYSESFEPQTGSDADGNTFTPTTSSQWEAGVKYNANGFNMGVTAYEIIKKDILTVDPDDENKYVQVGELRARGIELDIQKAITQEVSVSLSATLQDVEITKDSTNSLVGTTPIRIPEKQFNTWVSYKPQDGKLIGSSFGIGMRYVGEMQMDANNTDTLDPYKLVDLSVGYDLVNLSPKWKGASVQFSMSNVFDETYFSCYSTNYCWYGADRSFEITGRYEF
ncbi:TonB-dependent siderophore receptor [Marinomonas arenicola]|uniref:TonB-dependent siderophore receptor n=1 Tax=Marinomonas arenicola TaxID=569601 RepID=UPI00311DD96E